MIQFLLNQTLITEETIDPNMTVLNYLRQTQRRCGTKEGCATGDCGACTVTLGKVRQGKMQYETVNSCLTLMSSLNGTQLLTVEDLREGDALHSVQQAMVACHGSQCGFCTPGFVMSLFTLQKNSSGWDRHQAELALAGNLCRCTGYRPIMAAAEQACQTPQATLLAGGTDLTLHITQRYRPIPLLIALAQVSELAECRRDGNRLTLGAGATLNAITPFMQQHLPPFAAILQRFASLQVRNQGTLGGNIANASPIGDCAPMLLALDAELLLQCGQRQRTLPLADFFTGYRQTQLQPGEFIHAVVVEDVTASPNFAAWKVSKRLEDDISAVFAAFSLRIEGGVIAGARVAFGGMAAVPARALACEAALNGQPLTPQTLSLACRALAEDFQPLSDFRASADYRLQVAKNLLRRYFHQLSGELQITEVSRYVS